MYLQFIKGMTCIETITIITEPWKISRKTRKTRVMIAYTVITIIFFFNRHAIFAQLHPVFSNQNQFSTAESLEENGKSYLKLFLLHVGFFPGIRTVVGFIRDFLRLVLIGNSCTRLFGCLIFYIFFFISSLYGHWQNFGILITRSK